MIDLYYYPQNRWIYRGSQTTRHKGFEVKLSGVNESISRSVYIRPGKNELKEAEAEYIKSAKALESFFKEGSLVWAEDKKSITPVDSINESKTKEPAIEEIFVLINKASTEAELLKISQSDKRKEVLTAVKEKLAEIKKASVGS
jgi:hypothetical protein